MPSTPRRPSNALALRERLTEVSAATGPGAGGVTIRDVLERQRDQLVAALPRHFSVDRFLRLVLTEVRLNPALAKCTQASLVASMMKAAQLGLEPGPLGHCYLVPYRNGATGTFECTFILGYKGMIDLARRGGTIKSIEAREVCENDYFEFQYGLEEKLVHRPNLVDPGEPIAYYGVARFADGGHSMLVMSVAEIEKRRARSKAADKGPWVTDHAAMCRKTVIRAMAAFLPLSVEAASEIAEDGQREAIEPDARIDLGLAPPPRATQGPPEDAADASPALEAPQPPERKAAKQRAKAQRAPQDEPPEEGPEPEPEGPAPVEDGAQAVLIVPEGWESEEECTIAHDELRDRMRFIPDGDVEWCRAFARDHGWPLSRADYEVLSASVEDFEAAAQEQEVAAPAGGA